MLTFPGHFNILIAVCKVQTEPAWHAVAGRRFFAACSSQKQIVHTYFRRTKSLAFSLIIISPLFFIYEYNISRYNQDQLIEVRNAAEVYIKNFFGLFGARAEWHFSLIYLLFTLSALVVAHKQGQRLPRPAHWFAFAIETVLYAAFFGTVTRNVTRFLISLQRSVGMQVDEFWPQVLLALAAGVYEEMLFRLFLLGSLLLLFRTLLPAKVGIQVILAATISALLFALFHYQSADYVYWNSFVFRMVAGLILGFLYVYRGLGAAVYTHALYDLFFLYRKL